MVGDSDGEPATSDTLVPISCTSRVVGDSERDPLHSELIHPVVREAATAQHTITDQSIIHSPAPLSTDPPTPLSTYRVPYREGLQSLRTLLSIERSARFPYYLLVRFLWQRRGLKHLFRITSLPTILRLLPVGFSLSIIPVCQPL